MWCKMDTADYKNIIPKVKYSGGKKYKDLMLHYCPAGLDITEGKKSLPQLIKESYRKMSD